MADVDIGTGSTVTFTPAGGSAWSARILSYTHSGITMESNETTHMGTAEASSGFGSRTFIPGRLSDPGELTLSVQFDTGQADDTTQPPIELVAGVLVLTFPADPAIGTDPADWTNSLAFATSYEVTAEFETVITADVTFKLSGNVVIDPASA